MPAPRRQAKACLARMRHWFAVGGAYVGMLVFICITCHITWGVDEDPLAAEINHVTDRIGTLGRSIAGLQEQSTASRRKLDASRGVGQQPDWSVMLKLVADGLGNEVVLKSCELNEIAIAQESVSSRSAEPKISLTSISEDDKQIAFVLNIAGFGRSQTAVSQFVLRMERSGMFDNVRLESTMRKPFLNAKAVAFNLKCRLEGTTAGEQGIR
jgi:hypothetical protein